MITHGPILMPCAAQPCRRAREEPGPSPSIIPEGPAICLCSRQSQYAHPFCEQEPCLCTVPGVAQCAQLDASTYRDVTWASIASCRRLRLLRGASASAASVPSWPPAAPPSWRRWTSTSCPSRCATHSVAQCPAGPQLCDIADTGPRPKNRASFGPQLEWIMGCAVGI